MSLKPHLNPAVNEKIDQLKYAGGVDISDSFRVASETQGELLYNNKRVLITPKDEDYAAYCENAEKAHISYIHEDAELSSEEVVVAEIPRDARSFARIALMGDSPQGTSPKDAFYLLGQSVEKLADSGNLPSPADFILNKILLIRTELEVVMVPPMHFVSASDAGKNEIVESLEKQLFPQYEKFGAAALINSFKEGLES